MIMKMDDIQIIVQCGLFAVLGAASYYQWIMSPRNRGKYSVRRKWITILAAALITPACSLAMFRLLGFLPHEWALWVPIAVVCLLSLFIKPPADLSGAERASTRRIRIGVLIGAAILLAIIMSLIGFPSNW